MALALNTSHPLYADLLFFVGVDDDNTLIDLVTPSRTFAPHASSEFGSGAYGRHFGARRTSGTAACGATIDPAFQPANNTGTLVVVTNAIHESASATLATLVGAGASTNTINRIPRVGNAASGGKATFAAYNGSTGSTQTITSTVDYVAATPRMWAASRSAGGSAVAYIDGVSVGSGTLGNDSTSGVLAYIGGTPGSATVSADIVWIAWFGKVLTSTEISDLYTSLGANNTFALVESSGSDTTAPTLTSPTASATGATTASGFVTTDEANGTLYYLASANATELAATVKAGSSQAVTASGSQSVSITGLTASTSYYLHFVHRDAAGNDSTVASSAQFTTSAEGDTTPPTLTGPTGTATGATTASGTVSTNEATGTLYWLTSANATETGTAVKASSSQVVSAVGTQNVTASGLTASTAYYLHFLHRDAAGNDSTVATSAQFTTSAAPDTTVPTLTGSVTFASIAQTSYTASWPAGSDNVGVTGYEYQIGSTAGAWTDAGNNLSAAITGRTAGTTETVYVRDYDAAGLRSTPAISGSVTLLSASTDGTITVGSALYPIKYSSASVLNESGLRATVLDATTLAEVLNTSGVVCSNGVITITDAALVIGGTYHLAVKTASGWTGFSDVVTAS